MDLIYFQSPITNHQSPITNHYDAIVLAVAHDEYKKLSTINYGETTVVYDIKGILDNVDGRL
jgi:UDP-N-acetyl-D-galactosamine dehydrogenase